MQAPSSTAADLVAQLRSQECRQRSVLVFRGTGVNAWHYYPFLKHFSLAELSDFAGIYGMSGGAAIVWFYVLAPTGLFDEAVGRDFDHVIRTTMNQRGAFARVARVLRRQFPYSEEDVERFLSALPAGAAREQTLAALPLRNFCIVAHDKHANCLRTLDAATHPGARVIDLLSRAGTPHADDAAVSDFDFAGGDVKREFQRLLDVRHPGLTVYQVNMLREGVSERTVFVRSCADRFPRWSQALDLALLFAGLPNSHYRATFERSTS